MNARPKSEPSPIVHRTGAQFYDHFVENIKQRIRTAQIKAALAANAQLVLHYWDIGRDILASQKREGLAVVTRQSPIRQPTGPRCVDNG